MIKVKDGYAKLIGTTYLGSSTNVLLSNGGNFPIHSSRNNEANKLVRTDSNGFLQTGWINTTSGDTGTGSINKIYCSGDDYIRYKTPANFFSTLENSGNNISITVAGQNRTLLVGYASNSDKLDGYHYTSFPLRVGGSLYTTSSAPSVKLFTFTRSGEKGWIRLSISDSNNSSTGVTAKYSIRWGYTSADKSERNIILSCIYCSVYDVSTRLTAVRTSGSTFDVYYTPNATASSVQYLIEGYSGACTINNYTALTTATPTPTYTSSLLTIFTNILGNINGNASSATKLQTSRTLWGQSFNGTANVSGTMSEVPTIINLDYLHRFEIGRPGFDHWDFYEYGGVFNFYRCQDSSGESKTLLFKISPTYAYINGNLGVGTTSPSYKLHINGNAYISDTINSPLNTSTFLAGNLGKAIINSTASAGNYVMLFRGISTDGYFTLGVWLKSYLLLYTTKSTVDTGTNNVTKSATLLDESGNSSFPGYITSVGFKKSGSSDSYVLLGGGGHKTIDSFQTSYDGRYVKKSGDTMLGNLVFASGKQTRWTAHGVSYITDGNIDSGTSLGGDLANLVVSSWYGVSFTTSCSGQTYTNKTAVGINCRTGIVYAANFVGPLQGNAATATKLQTARKINGTSFDGTSDITTSAWGATRTISLTGAVTGSVLTNGSGNITISTTYGTGNITNLDNRYLKKTGDTMNGTLSFSPTNSSDASPKIYSTVSSDLTSLNFEVADDSDDRFVFRINYYNNTNNEDRERFIINWNGVTSKAPITAPSFKGNATSATQLLTSRKINGTSFNGTADITTAKWGTARTIYIQDASGTHRSVGVSVDGSTNYNLKLPSTITATLSGNASTATNADKLDGLHSTHYFRKYNRSDMGSSMNLNTLKTFGVFEVRTEEITTTNYPRTGYYPLLNFVNGEHVQIQIAGITGALYYRAMQSVNVGSSSPITASWASFIDSTNISLLTVLAASKLSTSRTINGTSFNGTSNITTSYWGTSRTLTIGNAGKSVNGSSNISWSLSEIGAAPTSHTHNYLVSRGDLNPLTGRTLNLGDVYSYNTTLGNTGGPTTYTSVIGFGRGTLGTIEIAGGWTSGMGLWYRALRNVTDNWFSWRAILDSSNYTSYITKLGTSTIGSSDTPIYLNGGTALACSYSFKGKSNLPIILATGTVSSASISVNGLLSSFSSISTANGVKYFTITFPLKVHIVSAFASPLEFYKDGVKLFGLNTNNIGSTDSNFFLYVLISVGTGLNHSTVFGGVYSLTFYVGLKAYRVDEDSDSGIYSDSGAWYNANGGETRNCLGSANFLLIGYFY